MANTTSDDIVGHGLGAAKMALEYISAIIADPKNATEDEGRALIVAICACIAGLNTRLYQNCPPEVYKESQELILRLMDGCRGKPTPNTAPEGKE